MQGAERLLTPRTRRSVPPPSPAFDFRLNMARSYSGTCALPADNKMGWHHCHCSPAALVAGARRLLTPDGCKSPHWSSPLHVSAATMQLVRLISAV